ncbi:MAG: hypothetical protein C0525_01295 [Flavobacterium sp.]|uniref:hypothetical protein n=1 Tax=Flavobacterium sp. TaxID=239 RepID=UPI0025C23F9D|nr:hypothetical protein [Flavobacterium sp.]MBA4133336.1 hypothetical protein [Flavobacterium sp.]
MFIDIENKENSAAKMAAVAGQPTKYYLFAQELNTMVSAINSLRHLISLNEGNINALLSTAPKIELGTIAVDFVDEINAMEELVIPSPVFITFTKDDIFYVYAFAGEANTYGTLNELYVTAEDFLPVYQSDEPGSPSTFNVITLNILAEYISTLLPGTGHLYLMDKQINVNFGGAAFIRMICNADSNGVMTIPRATGMLEIIRPTSTVSGGTRPLFENIDASRCLVLGTASAKTLELASTYTSAQLEFQFVLKEGTATLTTSTFTINGSLSTINLELNVLYRLKKVSSTEFVLTPKPGALGSSAWGGITGNIADQLDLIGILSSVANTAQWGSIGGSLPSQTDLVNFIRLAAPDNSFLNVVPSGWITTLNNYTSVVTNGTFSSTVSNSNNLTRFQPFVTNTVVNVDELYLSVQNNNTGASATATLYVFASDNNGLPGTKLHQEISATNIFNTPNSIITFGNNFTLEPGVYWIGIHIRDLNLASSNPAFYFASLGGDVKGIQSAAITFTNNFQGVLSVAATVADLSDNPAIIISASTALSVPMLKIKHQ